MKPLIACLMLLFVCAPAAYAEAGSADYTVSCKIYRIQANLSGNADLNVNETGIDDNEHYSLFNEASYKIGSMKFRMDDKGETWDGQPTPANKREVSLISTPRIHLVSNQPASIAFVSDERVQYMTPRPDGAFELTTTTLTTGMTLGFFLKERKPGVISFKNFTATIQTIVGREKIKGVQLEIGKPITQSYQEPVNFTITLDRPFGLDWNNPRGHFLFILRVTQAPR